MNKINSAIDKFVGLKITKEQLKSVLGGKLYNISIIPRTICAQDIINAIQLYVRHEIEIDALVDFVNVVWFTDLFEFCDNEIESIISVVEVLETLDEEGVSYTEDQFVSMIECLKDNKCYNCY